MKGPFRKNMIWQGSRAPVACKNQEWYTQERPYSNPLPYYVHLATADGYYYGADSVPPADSAGLPTDRAQLAAYEKFKSRLGERADLLTSLAERKQSQEMIVSRAIQLAKFANHVRKHEFSKAGAILGIRPTKKPYRRNPLTGEPYYRPNRLRRKAEDFSGNFLEYSFGWAPLVGDISNAVEVFANGIPPMKVTSSGSQPYRAHYFQDYFPGYTERIVTTGHSRFNYQGFVTVENSDLYLANQLGLINPVATAWELVPFSFLVDHFVSIGTFLSSVSDFAGVSISRTAIGLKQEYTTNFAYTGPQPGDNASWSYRSQSFRRTPAPIPLPPITLRPMTGLSLSRGATYIALLVQQLKGK